MSDGHKSMDISKATLPLSVVIAAAVGVLSYWVNAQESDISDNAQAIEDVEDDVQEQKLNVVKDIGDIKAQQQLGAQVQGQILTALKELKDSIDDL